MNKGKVIADSRMDEFFNQAKIEARTKESMEAINKGEVSSLDEFSRANRKWLKKNYTTRHT